MNDVEWMKWGGPVERGWSKLSPYVIERILDRSVAGPNGCIVYTGGTVGSGYGSARDRDGKTARAHRLICEAFHGPMTKKQFACHTCDNPPCVNPHHLFIGTCQENNRDRDLKGRTARGERSRKGKLTAKKVVKMHEMVSNGSSIAAAGRAMGVTPQAAWRALTGRNWAHLNLESGQHRSNSDDRS